MKEVASSPNLLTDRGRVSNAQLGILNEIIGSSLKGLIPLFPSQQEKLAQLLTVVTNASLGRHKAREFPTDKVRNICSDCQFNRQEEADTLNILYSLHNDLRYNRLSNDNRLSSQDYALSDYQKAVKLVTQKALQEGYTPKGVEPMEIAFPDPDPITVRRHITKNQITSLATRIKESIPDGLMIHFVHKEEKLAQLLSMAADFTFTTHRKNSSFKQNFDKLCQDCNFDPPRKRAVFRELKRLYTPLKESRLQETTNDNDLANHDYAPSDNKKAVTLAIRKALTQRWAGANALNHIQLGNIYLEQGVYDGAIAHYTQALAKAPDNSALYLKRGLAHAKLGHYQEALSDYGNALHHAKTPKKKAVAYVARGDLYGLPALAQYQEAVNDYTAAIDITAKRPYTGLYSRRGYVYSQLDQFHNAVKDYTEAIDGGDQSSITYSNRGDMYYALEKYDDAECDYSVAMTLEGHSLDIYYKRGSIRSALGLRLDAIEFFTAALAKGDTRALVYVARGYNHSELGEYQKAVEDYTEALAIDDTIAEVYSNRGVAYLKLHEYQKAADDFRTAIAKGDTREFADTSLRHAYSKLQAHEEAETITFLDGVKWEENQRPPSPKIEQEQGKATRELLQQHTGREL